MNDDQEPPIPPGVGPPGNRFTFLKRRTEPLWVIAGIIALPLIAVVIVALVRLLLHT